MKTLLREPLVHFLVIGTALFALPAFEGRLRLKINRAKSVVDRPRNCPFLGCTTTNNRQPRLKPAPKSVKRARIGFVRLRTGDEDETSAW